MKQPAISLKQPYAFPAYLVRAGMIGFVMGWIFLENVHAQAAKRYEVKAGKLASAVIPFQEQYRFPEFQEGKVIYTSGTSALIKLNYNILLEEMQFIDPKGDTLRVVNEYTLKRVQLGQALFYNNYTQGYYEVIASYPAIKLASKQVFQQIRSEDVLNNGYGTSPGESTEARSIRYLNTSPKVLKDIVLTQKVSYFVIDQNDRIYKASKATFLKLGKKHRQAITRYLEEESIDFKKEADLQKVVAFFNQLES